LKTNCILIDYENVQPEALSALIAEHFKVNQLNLSEAVARARARRAAQRAASEGLRHSEWHKDHIRTAPK
jgi:hypothetical protein